MTQAGTRTIVPLQNKWKREEDFSRWLGENIHILDQQIKEWKIDPGSVLLEVAAWDATRYVDVLCDAKRVENGESFKMVIENQFNGTDMDHFTRFMQYISIHDAKGAVWIAGYVYSEYIQLVQWLNDNSEIDVYLFTIELEHRESNRPEPVLTLVSGPDTERVPWDFTKTPAEKRRIWRNIVLPKVAAKCHEHAVWQDFKNSVSATWIMEAVQHEDSSVRESIFWYINGAHDGSTVGIYIPWTGDGRSSVYYDQIAEHGNKIDAAFATPHDDTGLSWERSKGPNGPCYVIWHNPSGQGYEHDDSVLMEAEADAVADAMVRLVNATKDVIAGIEPHQLSSSDSDNPNG